MFTIWVYMGDFMKKILKFMFAIAALALTIGIMFAPVYAAVQPKEYKEVIETETNLYGKQVSIELTIPEFIGFFETKIPVSETYFLKNGVEIDPFFIYKEYEEGKKYENGIFEKKERTIWKNIKIMVVRKTSEILNLKTKKEFENWKKGLILEAKYNDVTLNSIDSLLNNNILPLDIEIYIWDKENKRFYLKTAKNKGVLCVGMQETGVTRIIYDAATPIMTGGKLLIYGTEGDILSPVICDAIFALTEEEETYFLENGTLPTNETISSWEGIDLIGLKGLLINEKEY